MIAIHFQELRDLAERLTPGAEVWVIYSGVRSPMAFEAGGQGTAITHAVHVRAVRGSELLICTLSLGVTLLRPGVVEAQDGDFRERRAHGMETADDVIAYLRSFGLVARAGLLDLPGVQLALQTARWSDRPTAPETIEAAD